MNENTVILDAEGRGLCPMSPPEQVPAITLL